MKNDKIKVLIFDMDGVIVNSEPIHKMAEIQTCQEFGMNVPPEEWENFRGQKLDNIFTFVRGKYGKGDEPVAAMVARKIEIYLSHALKNMELIPGVYDFLTELMQSGTYRLALTTSGLKYQQDQILAKFDLAKFFEIVVTGDDVKIGKPDPEPYLITVKKLLAEAGDCLVIEDSDNGILSAKSAGCLACGITTTFSEEKLRLAGADEVVRNFLELRNSLKK
jgi:HAD superfamily hydrolase (TIGR01509 family)